MPIKIVEYHFHPKDLPKAEKKGFVSDTLGHILLVVVETDTDFLKNDLVVFYAQYTLSKLSKSTFRNLNEIIIQVYKDTRVCVQ